MEYKKEMNYLKNILILRKMTKRDMKNYYI